jgi:hypothetical protein
MCVPLHNRAPTLDEIHLWVFKPTSFAFGHPMANSNGKHPLAEICDNNTQCSKTHNPNYPHLETKYTLERSFVVRQHVVDGPRCLEDSFITFLLDLPLKKFTRMINKKNTCMF